MVELVFFTMGMLYANVDQDTEGPTAQPFLALRGEIYYYHEKISI